MRFTVAWSEVLSQNVVLRFVILCLSLSVIGLSVLAAKLVLREPLIIERACLSTALEKTSPDHTEDEISNFVKEALPQRFDTDAFPHDGFLSNEESQFREQEQKTMKEKEMRQRILINKVEKISGAEVIVNCDRILSVGAVRSALSFPLRLILSSVSRTRGNPYGLRLQQVKPFEKTETGEKKNEK
jgi:hypothetical protein